jgi:hypothetical protein
MVIGGTETGEQRAEKEHQVRQLFPCIDELPATTEDETQTQHATGEKRQIRDHVEEVRDGPQSAAIRECVIGEWLRHCRHEDRGEREPHVNNASTHTRQLRMKRRSPPIMPRR